jgi:hypothetical protein
MKLLQELLAEHTITETLNPAITNLAGQGLTKLPKGAPEVATLVNLKKNNLVSLKGSPKEVEGDFICAQNKLMSFSGGPQRVEGNFDASENRALTSLAGLPGWIGGNLSFQNCTKLADLSTGKYVEVGGSVLFHSCTGLKSAKGIEKTFTSIGSVLYLRGTSLTSNLLGILKIKGDFKIELDSKLKGIEQIINKHLKADRDLFDCQEDIIELAQTEGKPEWEAFAEL